MNGPSIIAGRRARVAGGWLKLALAGALGFAAIVHGVLTPDHIAESPLFGLGFLAAGASQLGFASLVLVRPTRVVYIAVIAVTAVLVGLYVANVVAGLPLHSSASHHGAAPAADHGRRGEASEDHRHAVAPGKADAHSAEEGSVGTPEPVDAVGVATQIAQLAAIGLAVTLLRRSASLPSWSPA